MIKVAFIIDTIHSPTAGTENQLLLLLENLSREKIEPHLFCLRSSDWLEKEFRSCPLVNLEISSFHDLKSLAQFRRFCTFIRSRRIDIIQTHFHDANYIGILAAKPGGVRAVISTRRGEPYFQNRLELCFLRLLDRKVHTFIANSHASASFFCAHEKIPPAKMNVIYNGINLSDFSFHQEQRAAIRAQLGIAPDMRLVGIVANLRPVKGIEVFLRAAAFVRKQFRQVRFMVVGEGEEKGNLLALTEKLDLRSDVCFLGRRNDVPRLLAAFDIGVLSSNYESFSNSILEYQAAALPVVCTDVGGAREAIVDGTTGYLVPAGNPEAMADRIGHLLISSALRQMGALGQQRVHELFSINVTAKSYETLYMQVMDQLNQG
jgi:L-malate glycosyltransferase